MDDTVTRFEIAKLDLREGDKLVVKTDMILNKIQVDYIKELWLRLVPSHEVIVLTGGMTVEILRNNNRPPIDNAYVGGFE